MKRILAGGFIAFFAATASYAADMGARVSAAALREAEQLATSIAQKLGVVGLLAVEMFLAANGEVLVNELAPRPHNSGHWSLDGC